jgi:ubiquinone biosynthesis protein Coq4
MTMGFWNQLRVLRIFIQLVRNPNRTDLIFKGVEIASSDQNQEPLKAVEQKVLSNPDFKAMYDKGYLPSPPSLDGLANLAPGTFGYALYEHMKNNSLNFDLFPQLDVKNPINYLSARIYQDHDLWHALLGYGVEVEDELAIQAFGVAQFSSPIGTMIIAGGLLHLLSKNPLRAVEAFKKVNAGYNMGMKAKFLLGVRLHDLFAEPLEEVRLMCRAG